MRRKRGFKFLTLIFVVFCYHFFFLITTNLFMSNQNQREFFFNNSKGPLPSPVTVLSSMPPSSNIQVNVWNGTNTAADQQQTTTTTSPRRVLILSSNPRSGSSLLADLISSHPQSVYFFEPLRYLSLYNRMLDTRSRERRRPIAMSRGRELVKPLSPQLPFDMLKKFATCNMTNFRYFFYNAKARDFLFRKPNLKLFLGSLNLGGRRNFHLYSSAVDRVQEACDSAEINVIKLIRIRLEDFKKNYSPFTHVIYLVRDPRASLNSLLKPIAKTEFQAPAREVHNICDNLERDLDELEEEELVRKRKNKIKIGGGTALTLVRYEDLVSDPMGVGTKLFSFLDLPASFNASETIRDFWTKHSQDSPHTTSTSPKDVVGEEGSDSFKDETFPDISEDNEDVPPKEGVESNWYQGLGRYYATFREPGFDPNHWIKELDKNLLYRMESHPKCQRVIRRLGYKFLTQ